MFLGDYQHTLDAKGRVSLPAKFRAEMTGKVIIAKGFEQCLYVYPAEEYQAQVNDLLQKQAYDSRVRRMRHFFIAGAVEGEFDGAGRISLPAVLREYAGLGKDVAVIGNGNFIEIWDAEAWKTYNTEDVRIVPEEGSIEALAEALAKDGLL